MAWYHAYQYAEPKPDRGRLSHLRNKALPIIRYEITDRPPKIISVEVAVNKATSIWLNRDDIILYRGSQDFVSVPEKRQNRSQFLRLLRSLNLTPWRKQ